jgi:hypothetical protein
MNSVVAVGAVSGSERSGIANFAESAMEALKQHEDNISDSFREGLNPGGAIMKVPDSVMSRFKAWESAFTRPEDLAMVAAVKQKTLMAMRETADYVAEQAEKKVDRVRLELALKAVSKTTQSVQQLLSSQ